MGVTNKTNQTAVLTDVTSNWVITLQGEARNNVDIIIWAWSRRLSKTQHVRTSRELGAGRAPVQGYLLPSSFSVTTPTTPVTFPCLPFCSDLFPPTTSSTTWLYFHCLLGSPCTTELALQGSPGTKLPLLLIWALPATKADRPRSEDELRLFTSWLAVGKLFDLCKPQLAHPIWWG